MAEGSTLQELARSHGTPLFVVDHEVLRSNYAEFKLQLPRVQAYYAVKANPDPEIVRTLYRQGASFDVASIAEFRLVHTHVRRLSSEKQQAYIWDKIIYANPIKATSTLEELDPYKPLVTYDNFEEIEKVQRHAPQAGLVLRLRVPNTGSVVELSSKFGAAAGEAVELITAAHEAGLVVEGLCFHVGSQCMNFDNYVQALSITSAVLAEARSAGYEMKLIDIGGGFPARYDQEVGPFEELARIINAEVDRLFGPEIEILAEPGRFLVATAATLVAEVIGKARRDGRTCYYLNDGIYGTFNGILFDHCQYPVKAFREGPTELCKVFGPTCDAMDIISRAEALPELSVGDLVYSENIGAYSIASATQFNGFGPTRVVHVNR